MQEFISNKILRNNPIISYLIINSPVIIGLGVFFLESMAGDYIFKIPLVIYFFPFPVLLFQIVWMDSVYKELISRINCNTNLNNQRFVKLMSISKLTLFIISLVALLTEVIFLIDINSLQVWFKAPLIVFYIVLILFMLLANYSFFYGANFIGKLIVVAETQQPFNNQGNTTIHLDSFFGLSPNRYIKTHRRLEKILNE